MKITVLQKQARVPVTIVELEGNLDSASYLEFQQRVNEAIAAGAKDVLVDMSQVAYMSSAGLRALTQIFNQLHNEAETRAARQAVRAGNFKSPHLKLAGVSRRALQALQMAGFDEYIDIRKTRADALTAF